MTKPCEKCGNNRWKTKHKNCPDKMGREYECRNCGYIRFISRKDDVEALYDPQ